MAVNATDNEDYATELWGDDKHWDDNLGQWVPEGGKLSPGISSSPSQSNSDKQSETNPGSDSKPAPTTENPSGQDPTGGSIAPSTGTARKVRSK